jgi:hypothetical protein
MGSDAWTGAMRQEAAVLGYVQMDHRDAGTWVQTNNEILKVLAIVSSETEP